MLEITSLTTPSIHETSGQNYIDPRYNADMPITVSVNWSESITDIQYEFFYGRNIGEKRPYNGVAFSIDYEDSSDLSSSNVLYYTVSDSSQRGRSAAIIMKAPKSVIYDTANSAETALVIIKVTVSNGEESATAEIAITTTIPTLSYSIIFDGNLYKAAIEDGEIIKGEEYDNLCVELYCMYSPEKLSSNTALYSVSETHIYGFTASEWGTLDYGINNITIDAIIPGLVKITAMLIDTTSSDLIELNSNNQIIGDTNVIELSFGVGLTDGTTTLYGVRTESGYISLSQINERPTVMFINKTTGTISLGGKLDQDTSKLHIYGSLIASNITDLLNRLDIAEYAIHSLQQNFEVEEVASKTYTTKAASTYENVGLSFDPEIGNLYALYSTSDNGYIKGMQIRNSSGTIYFDWMTNGNRYGAYCLPVCYCRGTFSNAVNMWVSRSATGSNTYKVYKVMKFL